MNKSEEKDILHGMKACGKKMDAGDIDGAKAVLDNMFKDIKYRNSWDGRIAYFRGWGIWFNKKVKGIIYKKEF